MPCGFARLHIIGKLNAFCGAWSKFLFLKASPALFFAIFSKLQYELLGKLQCTT